MPVKPARYKGAYIPFPVPVKGAEIGYALIDDDPLTKICFNSSYLPIILGALKVLGREETYEDDQQTNIDFFVDNGRKLLTMYSDGCDSGFVAPTWDFSAESGFDWSYGQYINAVGGSPSSLRVYMGGFLQLSGKTIASSPVLCGGKLRVAHYQAYDSGTLISVTGHTCQGQLISDNSVGSWDLSRIGSNTEIHDLTLVATDNGVWLSETLEPYTCVDT